MKKSDLDAKLNALRPGILGALLTALCQTLAEIPKVNPEELPRMADYGHFAIAAQKALGLEEGDFWRAYNSSRETARSVVLESSPLAEAIRNLMSREGLWQGTAQELLKTLESYTEEATLRSKFWPKSSTSLSRQLNRLTPDLEAVGIQVEVKKSNGIKFIQAV